MANNQGTQQESEWSNNKEMNIKENSSSTDSIKDEGTDGESSWRATDGEEETKTTKISTGAAGKSSAEQSGDPGRTPGKAEG